MTGSKRGALFGRAAVIIAALTLLALTGVQQARASLMELDFSGTFDDTATIGGNSVGDESFSYQAVFDPTVNVSTFGPDTGVFDITYFSILVNGTDVYQGVPAPGDLQVFLVDPNSTFLGGVPFYFAGLVDQNGSGIGPIGVYGTSTPDFDASTPVPAVMSDLLVGGEADFGFTVNLVGPLTPLIFSDSGSPTGDFTAGDTATLRAFTAGGTPEPATLALSVCGAGALVLAAARRRRQVA